MKAKSKILFPILTICTAICMTALTFFAVTVEGSTPSYPFTFPSSEFTCDTHEQCYDYCATVVPGSGSGDGGTCDEYFPGAIDDGTTGDSCGSNTCVIGEYCADYENGWCCPTDKPVVCLDDGSCVYSTSECLTVDDCPDGHHLDSTNTCVADDTGIDCGTGYWDPVTNTCVYVGMTCSDGHHLDSTNTCVADDTGIDCGTGYWDPITNICVYNDDGTTGDPCGSNTCAPNYYCADPVNNQCCLDGTVPCPNGDCVFSTSECLTVDDCPDGYYMDSAGSCMTDDITTTDCGTDQHWDPITNICVYNDDNTTTCGPHEYWDNKYDTCKPISSGEDIVYTVEDINEGPGGCKTKEECDIYCKDPNNTKECIEFAVDSGFMTLEEAKTVLLMLEKDITEGPGGCQSKEECDAYCDDPANMEECIEFAVKVGFMTSEEAERIMEGGPGGCKTKEECDAYCSDSINKEECTSFAIENDMFKDGPKMVSPAEIKTVLEKVTEPAKCETELECKIYCSSADANKELCQVFSTTVIVEDKIRSITEFIDSAEVEEVLLQGMGPGETKDVQDIHAYCSNPTHYEECRKFVSEKELLNKETLDEKIEELEKKRLEKERMFAERVGSRVYEDSDNDGVSDYDELNIFYTDPNVADTDGDGVPDGTELLLGRDPLSGLSGDQPIATGTDMVVVEDDVIYEDPKIAGEEKPELIVTEKIKVLETEMSDDGKEKAKKISFKGTAPANSFVTLYIYSTPIIVTVKTDENGNWSYVLDKELEDGNHEIHVAITDNAGKIFAKSRPLPFVKEAAAVSIGDESLFGGGDTEISIFDGRYLYIIVLLIIVIIGWVLIFTGSKSVKLEKQIINK